MRFNPDDYVDVQERIVRFWEEYPEGAIRTELASPASAFTEVVFRAEVYKDRTLPAPDAVGYAAEKPGNGANQTSWHENCETSAIGRALANMGYATSRSDRPSRQEMRKVERSQPEPQVQAARERQMVEMANERHRGGPPMTGKQRGFLISLAKQHGMVGDDGHHDEHTLDAECKRLTGKGFDELGVGDAKLVIDAFQNGGIEKSSEPEASPHPMVQTAIDNREANYLAAIEGAATMPELLKVQREINGAGAGNDVIWAKWYARKKAIEERAA